MWGPSDNLLEERLRHFKSRHVSIEIKLLIYYLVVDLTTEPDFKIDPKIKLEKVEDQKHFSVPLWNEKDDEDSLNDPFSGSDPDEDMSDDMSIPIPSDERIEAWVELKRQRSKRLLEEEEEEPGSEPSDDDDGVLKDWRNRYPCQTPAEVVNEYYSYLVTSPQVCGDKSPLLLKGFFLHFETYILDHRSIQYVDPRMNATQVGLLILANYPKFDGLVDWIGDELIDGDHFQHLDDSSLRTMAPFLSAEERILILRMQWTNFRPSARADPILTELWKLPEPTYEDSDVANLDEEKKIKVKHEVKTEKIVQAVETPKTLPLNPITGKQPVFDESTSRSPSLLSGAEVRTKLEGSVWFLFYSSYL